MAFNIFSTLNQNLQNLGGNAYDAYQAGKSKVGNVASTINTNLQDFGGDIYDVGSTIKKNVSNFGTQTYNQGKQAINQIESNVSQFGSNVANKASSVKKSILAPADRFMTDVTKIGNARKATQYGISEKDKSALMNQMLDAGQYSDDEIIQAVAQLDAEEKARKQKEFADWQAGNKANANIGQKALAGALNLGGGAIAGIGQGTLGIADFATGGKIDALKQEKQAYDEAIAKNQGAFTLGKNIGQIGASFAAPGLGKLAPTGTSLAATAGRGAVYGGIYGAANPIMEKGSEATASDIGYGALGGATTGAIAGPLLEKVVAPAIGKTIQSATSGINAAKFAQGSLVDKAKAGIQATGKNIARGIKSIPTGGETLTRNIPTAIVKRDLGFDRTQRGKIENILGGMDEAQYVLKKGLAGKPKDELAEIFMKQADDAYNGITSKLAKINKTVKSPSADEALQDILDQLNSSPKIQRAYQKDIIGVENMLKKGEYTLSELNNIRRAYDKVNTGMFTVQGKARSGIENDIDVKVRRGLSNQLQKEAKLHGVDVKEMNKELRAGLAMKDALLVKLSQEGKNNFLGLQDLGVSAILSGGEPVSAVATIAAKKYAEKVAPGLAQKAYNLNTNPNVTRRVSRGNTITPRNKSSGLGLASSSSAPVVSDTVKPPIVPKAKPRATTESPFKNNKGFINPSEIKKSLIPKKGLDEAKQFYDDLVYAGNSPIVAQRETAKRFGTIRAMSASKAGTMEIPEALAQEARKYKSADEFINSKIQRFHQTSPDYAKSIEKEGFSLKNRENSHGEWLPEGVNTKLSDKELVLKNKGTQLKVYIDKNSKIGDFQDRNAVENYIRNHKEGGEFTRIMDDRNSFDRKYIKMVDDVDKKLTNNLTKDQIKENLAQQQKIIDEWKIGFEQYSKQAMQEAKKILSKEFDAISIAKDEGGFGKVTDNTIIFDPSKVKTESQLKQIYEQANKK